MVTISKSLPPQPTFQEVFVLHYAKSRSSVTHCSGSPFARVGLICSTKEVWKTEKDCPYRTGPNFQQRAASDLAGTAARGRAMPTPSPHYTGWQRRWGWGTPKSVVLTYWSLFKFFSTFQLGTPLSFVGTPLDSTVAGAGGGRWSSGGGGGRKNASDRRSCGPADPAGRSRQRRRAARCPPKGEPLWLKPVAEKRLHFKTWGSHFRCLFLYKKIHTHQNVCLTIFFTITNR